MKRALAMVLMVGLLGMIGLMAGCDNGTKDVHMLEGSGVYYRYTYAARNLDREIKITDLGEMSVEQINAGVHETASLKLTPQEQAQVGAAFKNWTDLKPFYNVIFGPVFVISYNGHKVESSGASDTPEQFLKAKVLLDQLADEAIAQSKAAPATQR